MLPLEKFKMKYKITQLVVVSDTVLMFKENINEFTKKKYKFIIGARIKNESESIKNKYLH